tara:strand:- start:847 stop:1029 length:183 start_codon:yes stop_codon:yes gene_type:complete
MIPDFILITFGGILAYLVGIFLICHMIVAIGRAISIAMINHRVRAYQKLQEIVKNGEEAK